MQQKSTFQGKKWRKIEQSEAKNHISGQKVSISFVHSKNVY